MARFKTRPERLEEERRRRRQLEVRTPAVLNVPWPHRAMGFDPGPFGARRCVRREGDGDGRGEG